MGNGTRPRLGPSLRLRNNLGLRCGPLRINLERDASDGLKALYLPIVQLLEDGNFHSPPDRTRVSLKPLQLRSGLSQPLWLIESPV